MNFYFFGNRITLIILLIVVLLFFFWPIVNINDTPYLFTFKITLKISVIVIKIVNRAFINTTIMNFYFFDNTITLIILLIFMLLFFCWPIVNINDTPCLFTFKITLKIRVIVIDIVNRIFINTTIINFYFFDSTITLIILLIVMLLVFYYGFFITWVTIWARINLICIRIPAHKTPFILLSIVGWRYNFPNFWNFFLNFLLLFLN